MALNEAFTNFYDLPLDYYAMPNHPYHKLHKQLRHAVGKAINDFSMIQENDRVMVCLSGGKDSYTLLDLLCALQKHAPVSFELIAVHLDQKQPGTSTALLSNYLQQQGIPFHIIEKDTHSIVERLIPANKTRCSLCSRLRRGILYRVATTLGATKIALGHHREDLLATLLLNMFYAGNLKTMPPKLRSDNGKHIVIRPLVYCREKDIIRYAQYKQFPLIPCNVCGSQPNLQRQVIMNMLRDWDKRFPGRLENMFRAMCNVVPSHLADPQCFDFKQCPSSKPQHHETSNISTDSDTHIRQTINFLASRKTKDERCET